MAETVNLNTVFSGFDSGTDLNPKNTRTNNQGVTINEIAGFIKVVDDAPTTGSVGDMVFNTSNTTLYICSETDTFVSVALAE